MWAKKDQEDMTERIKWQLNTIKGVTDVLMLIHYQLTSSKIRYSNKQRFQPSLK